MRCQFCGSDQHEAAHPGEECEKELKAARARIVAGSQDAPGQLTLDPKPEPAATKIKVTRFDLRQIDFGKTFIFFDDLAKNSADPPVYIKLDGVAGRVSCLNLRTQALRRAKADESVAVIHVTELHFEYEHVRSIEEVGEIIPKETPGRKAGE